MIKSGVPQGLVFLLFLIDITDLLDQLKFLLTRLFLFQRFSIKPWLRFGSKNDLKAIGIFNGKFVSIQVQTKKFTKYTFLENLVNKNNFISFLINLAMVSSHFQKDYATY